MFPVSLRLPFLCKPLPPVTPAVFRSVGYCIVLNTPAVGWLHRRLLDAIRFQADKVLVLDDINALIRAEGETPESNRAKLVGGFSYSLEHLYELHDLILDLDTDGGLLLVNCHEAYLLVGWLEHEVDFFKVCPGRYLAMTKADIGAIAQAFIDMAGQIDDAVELHAWADLGRTELDKW